MVARRIGTVFTRSTSFHETVLGVATLVTRFLAMDHAGLQRTMLQFDLGTLIVVTYTDGALTSQTVSPEAAKLNVSLGHVQVGE